ncbi:MAG: hypothetical protein ACYDEE_12205 [Ignavibacteriaceae bacterium]
MKTIFLILSAISLFLIGCLSTYKISDFSSKTKFYDDFNEFARSKNVNIILTNDSALTAPGGAMVSNDTLNIVTRIKKKERKILYSEISKIKYYNNNYPNLSANILLKDGEKVTGDNVKIFPDSSIQLTILQIAYKYLPLEKVKEVSYKNHWLGVPTRLIAGTVSGFALGYAGVCAFVDPNEQSQKAFYVGWGITAIGLVTGGIIGWIDGYDYIYQFNP